MLGSCFLCKILIDCIDTAYFNKIFYSLPGIFYIVSFAYFFLMQSYWVSLSEICLLFTVGADILFIVIVCA